MSSYKYYQIQYLLTQDHLERSGMLGVKCLQNIEELLKKIFVGQGTFNQNNFVCNEWIVSLTGILAPNTHYICPGGWINTKTKMIGLDLISLHAEKTEVNYLNTIILLSEYFKQYPKNKKGKTKKPEWHQELLPLGIPKKSNDLMPLFFNQFYYYNKAGIVIGRVYFFFVSPSGSLLSKYQTIWKRSDQDHILYWMDFFPEIPYFLFNAHLIATKTDASIHLVENELVAINCQSSCSFNQLIDNKGETRAFSEIVFSTCPGGLKNLLHADFTGLHGRSVYIHVLAKNNPIIQQLPQIIDRLQKHNVSNIFLIYLTKQINPEFIDKDENIIKHTFISCEDFFLEPSLYGYTVNFASEPNIFTHSSSEIYQEDSPELNRKQRIPKKIKQMAMISFLREYKKISYKKISYKKIQDQIGISRSTVCYIYNKQIHKLSDKDKLKHNAELDRLIKSEEPS